MLTSGVSTGNTTPIVKKSLNRELAPERPAKNIKSNTHPPLMSREADVNVVAKTLACLVVVSFFVETGY